MNTLFYALLATLIVSVISLVGVVSLLLKESILNKILFYLVAISAGSLMGSAFLHLIPEAVESSDIANGGVDKIFIFVLIGFALFFILERVLHWHHCHKHGGVCSVHTFTYLNVIGDGFHNFIDGLVIMAAFSLSFELGVATTLGVIIHEIPQEISDFGVLIYGGLSKVKALIFNFLSGTLAILGTLVGYMLVGYAEEYMPLLVAVTAGGFIYIAASDLIPELHKESKFPKSLIAFICFFVGVGLMVFLKMGHGN